MDNSIREPSEANLSWEELARKTVQELEKYDAQNKTFYAYYLDSDIAIATLGQCMEKANKSLLWRKV